MKVLVTGANSLLGTNVILELIERGYTVRGFLRDKKKFKPPTEEPELYEGDISCRDHLSRASKGCSLLIHTAAVTDPALDRRTHEKINTEGTNNVMEAARDAGIKRVVFVSTANTIGHGTMERPGTEAEPPARPFTDLPYALSKIKAEKIVNQSAENYGIKAVTVNPTFIIGPWDSKPGSGKIIMMGYNRRLVFVPPGGKNFIPVKDAAAGVCNALERGKGGERYLLAGENMKYLEFFRLLKDVTKGNSILIPLPKLFLLIAGAGGSLLKLAGRKTAVTITTMRVLCTGNYYSAGKAERELDLPRSSLHVAVKEAVEWFRKHDMIK